MEANDDEDRTAYAQDEADAGGFGLEDDSGAVIAAVGRQIRLWREAAGMRPGELGVAIGYSENLVYKVESGTRIPKPEFLDRADEVLGAGGKISAMQKDVAEARYPKKVRDLARLEADAVEIGSYTQQTLHALLQTPEYARALFGTRRPLYSEDVIERAVAARLSRQEIMQKGRTTPIFSFIQDEVSLHRPLGGREVHRRQLEHLLEVGKLRNVELQVLPTALEDHAGLMGGFRVFKLSNGDSVGYTEVQHLRQVVSDAKEVQVLEMIYGSLRAQALAPPESLATIEKVLGET
ncbi:helix-turn-helix transcriptional regulator [uncultured Streptomyces sp.]|uniref:helix-turn-helix domain-containing protein n=1 Tax=uncultured Streptomyces sp. TaxID=174707 RepID=UPI00341649C5